MTNIDGVLHETSMSLDGPAREYFEFHVARYRLLLGLIDRELTAIDAPDGVRILDVGPAYQTQLIRRLWPFAVVDTLGFDDTRFVRRPGERHIDLDLNSVDESGAPTPEPTYYIIVFAEVLEHLTAHAPTVLSYLRRFLTGRGLMIVQTPNAVSAPRRLKMLLGRNPAEPIRNTRTNPGHFHEFTRDELELAARESGLVLETLHAHNYFTPPRPLRRRVTHASERLLPPSLRDGFTVLLRSESPAR